MHVPGLPLPHPLGFWVTWSSFLGFLKKPVWSARGEEAQLEGGVSWVLGGHELCG